MQFLKTRGRIHSTRSKNIMTFSFFLLMTFSALFLNFKVFLYKKKFTESHSQDLRLVKLYISF